MSPSSRIGMAFLVLALLTVIPYIVFKHNGREDFHRLQAEVAGMRDGNQKLDNENRRLRVKIDAFKSDPQLIERMVRERLQLARPGEVIMLFEDPAPTLIRSSENTNNEPSPVQPTTP